MKNVCNKKMNNNEKHSPVNKSSGKSSIVDELSQYDCLILSAIRCCNTVSEFDIALFDTGDVVSTNKKKTKKKRKEDYGISVFVLFFYF